MNTKLAHLLDGNQVWLGNKQLLNNKYSVTGYPLLDEKLRGGWPDDGVIELQTINGIGEFRLLAPYLSHLAISRRLMMFINAPSIINSQMLAFNNIAPSSVVLVSTHNDNEQRWSAEQSLRSGCVSIVVLWQQTFSACQIKRLKLAASYGNSRLIIIRSPQQLNPLPVNLSLALSPVEHGLNITINKQQGRWPQPAFVLDMSLRWPDLVMHRQPANVIHLPKRRVS